MRKSLVILIVALSLATVELSAQVTKRVEVTKAYTPEINRAKKLMLEPDMSDTVTLRPDIDYSITPRSIESRLSQSLYQPMIVPLSESKATQSESLYTKVALGAPFSSLLDIYASKPLSGGGYIMGYINHSGDYGKRDNIYGESTSANQSQNVLGVAVRKTYNEKQAETNVYYVHDIWDRYATPTPEDNHVRYQRLGVDGSYGDNYSDWSRWNFATDVGLDMFWANGGNDVTSFDLGVNAGHKLGMGKLYLGAEFYLAKGSGDYQNNSISFESSYTFTLKKLDFKLGAVYLYDVVDSDVADSKDSNILPSLKVKSNHFSGFKPFVEIDTKLQRNDFASLTDINPYIESGQYLGQNTTTYNFRAGIEGDLLNQKLTYRLYTEYSTSENGLYWVFATPEYLMDDVTMELGEDNFYIADLDDKDALSLNIDAEYRVCRSFKVNMAMSLTDYHGSYLEVGEPKFELSLGAEYKVDKLTIGIGADYMSKRYNTYVNSIASPISYARIKTPQSINLKASAQLRVKQNLAIFIDLDNLMSDDVYQWAGYKEYGASVMAGVKIQF